MTTRRTLPCPRGSTVAPSGRSPGSWVQEVRTSSAASTFPGSTPSGESKQLPIYSGGTAPDFDRLPFYAPAGTRSVDLDSKKRKSRLRRPRRSRQANSRPKAPRDEPIPVKERPAAVDGVRGLDVVGGPRSEAKCLAPVGAGAAPPLNRHAVLCDRERIWRSRYGVQMSKPVAGRPPAQGEGFTP